MSDSSTAQAGTTQQGDNQNLPAGDSGKTFTQEEVNSMLAKEKRDMQAKYKDFDKYKQAFEEQQKQDEANKSELQKALDAQKEAESKLSQLQAERDQATWIAAASKATGVPQEALHGSTEEEINACAEALKEYFTKPAAPVVHTGKPSEGGSDTSGDPLRDAILNK